jgi:hypothetical protein
VLVFCNIRSAKYIILVCNDASWRLAYIMLARNENGISGRSIKQTVKKVHSHTHTRIQIHLLPVWRKLGYWP